MSLGSFGSAPTFSNHVRGMLGEFHTPAGRVSYLMTKARLGTDSTDPERRLTQHLVPFREVIPSEELDFNQLLQRDLDDHRVAVSLVPYLLNPIGTGPAFFPPVIAIALPFDQQRPSEFPTLGDAVTVKEEGLFWSQRDSGQSIRIQRLAGENGKESTLALGQLWWNSEFCRIVVVDGQHRAMALLAIDRTLRGTWQNTPGARYRYFYEGRIKQAIKEHGPSLDHIEVPVTILWFPDLFGEGKKPHSAARKVFVDVNKEARTPSESRLILLSDNELANIFTRATLTQLRNQDDSSFLPLYAVEYDNPDTKTTQSARWSALTNIHILKNMATRAVFGPPKYVKNMSAIIAAREPENEKNAFMRVQLEVSKLFPLIIEGDRHFMRDQLGNKEFPESAVDKLTKAYQDSWGTALLALLSKIHPFAAHARALSRLKQEWLVDDAIATLAHDALFSGVGMYWTLKDSWTFWREEEASKSGSSKPDVVQAWQTIVEKQSRFEELRAEELLGSKTRREEANQLYQAVNTHACQLGLSLTLAAVYARARHDGTLVTTIADAMAAAINEWMLSKTSGDYDRRLALSKRKDGYPKNALNVIANMDMPRAVQFRYFWLEILCSPQAENFLSNVVDSAKLSTLRYEARAAYIAYVAGEKQKALKTSAPELNELQRKKQAEGDAQKEIRSALMRWFEISAAEVDFWFQTGGSAAIESVTSETEVEIMEESEEAADEE